MKTKTIEAINAHAIAEYPRECCGLVIAIGRKEEYVPCRNMADADKSEDEFRLSTEDYAAAADRGLITHIVHSHPNAAARPTPADLLACENLGLPWYIVAVHGDPAAPELAPVVMGSCEFAPTGYQMPYIGREFKFGMVDCYTMVRDFYLREMGVELTDFERTDKFWERGEDLYMDNFAAEGFTFINEPSQRGDLILMSLRSPIVNHAAIWLGEADHILHHPYNHLSERTVLTGYWLENTRHYIRRTQP
jgi:proteasome lid subunit RPN8/RPN11